MNRTMIIVAAVLFVLAAFLGIAIVAALYLSGGQTYPVVIASQDLSPNTKLSRSQVKIKKKEDPPAKDIVKKDQIDKIIGKVVKRNIKAGDPLKPQYFREKFLVYKTDEPIAAGNRIQDDMIVQGKSDKKPANVVTNKSDIMDKMVKEGINKGAILRRTDVYQSNKKFVVATQTIEPNNMVRENQVKVVSKPRGPSDGISDKSKVIGRPLKSTIPQGEEIRQSDLYSGDIQLSHFIPLYKRTVTIPISNYNSVSYMLRPGDWIDLYIYSPQDFQLDEAGSSQNVSVDVLQKLADGAEVLMLNDKYTKKQIKQYEKGGKKGKRKFTYNNMTLAVTLREAEEINLIRAMKTEGANFKFFVILRPKIQRGKYGKRRVTNLELFNASAQSKANNFIYASEV
ncbi:MAG: RcpC/CpaB family pilus assembly protein, partial [bacterium]